MIKFKLNIVLIQHYSIVSLMHKSEIIIYLAHFSIFISKIELLGLFQFSFKNVVILVQLGTLFSDVYTIVLSFYYFCLIIQTFYKCFSFIFTFLLYQVSRLSQVSCSLRILILLGLLLFYSEAYTNDKSMAMKSIYI